MKIIAHRGGSGAFPENTLEAVRATVMGGAEWVELDVQLVESTLILFHDQSLERMTDREGLLINASVQDVAAAGLSGGAKIPLLSEFLSEFGGKVFANLELKTEGAGLPAATLLGEAIDSLGWSESDFLVTSFLHHELKTVRDVAPWLKTGVLLYGVPLDLARTAELVGASAVVCNIETCTEALAEDVLARGKELWLFTVNTLHEFHRARSLGAEGIISDFPQRLAACGRECE